MKYPRNARRDQLEEVELKIARRADQLAAASRPRTPLNLHWWTEAEREILGHSPSLFVATPAAASAGGAGQERIAAYAAEPQLADAS